VSIAGYWNWPRRAAVKLLRYDPLLLKLVARSHVDLVSHLGIGRQSSVNTLQWQPDFQHRVLPEFFSKKDRRRRDTYVENAGIWGNILLSSQSSADDFRRFYPELSAVRTQILRFCNVSILDSALTELTELSQQYPVQLPFFYLPNQFWTHKNHSVVVEALRALPAEIRVICTGSIYDPRNPSYVPALFEKVKQAGLEDRFICLGVVPYQAVVSLMHYSIAVLQPSLFEGWSTSVEESKTMCKQIILSRIDTHIEQAPDRGLYFSPNSSEELASRLWSVYSEYDPAVERGFVVKRVQNGMRMSREFSKGYADIVKQVIRG
jgi:glycosyltransferase involved in cell wall biosynthesis